MKKEINKLDFWARSEETGHWFHIKEGTGDNLLTEDQEQGYIDYIYYDIYDSLDDVNEEAICDGGMYMLTKYYQDMELEEIVQTISEWEDEKLTVIE